MIIRMVDDVVSDTSDRLFGVRIYLGEMEQAVSETKRREERDPAWGPLRDLAFLRHLIVHRGGRQGPDKKTQEKLAMLRDRYGQDLSLSDEASSEYAEIVVSPALCLRMLNEVEGLFRRLFEAAKLRGVEQFGWSDAT